MGRVYSAEQIKNGEIPGRGAHEAAGQQALEELFPLVVPAQTADSPDDFQLFDPDGPGVQSAMVYGSTAYGTSGPRSDVDILIFYGESQAKRALGHISKVIKDTEDTHKVYVESNILPVGAVYDDLEHGLDPLFASHLLEIHEKFNGRWCRNNPTGGLERIAARADNPLAVASLAHRYVSGRRNYFASADREGEADLNILQRALELPSAIGRKVVAATMNEEDDPLDLSSRQGMHERAQLALMVNMPSYDKNLVSAHSRLYQLDQEYTQLLEAATAGEVTPEDYDEWLEGNYLPAIDMAYELSQAWVDIMRAKKQKISRRVAAIAVRETSFLNGDDLPVVDVDKVFSSADSLDMSPPASYS